MAGIAIGALRMRTVRRYFARPVDLGCHSNPEGLLKSRFVVLLALGAACGNETTGNENPCTDPDQGPFIGEAAVAVSGSLAGCASFGVASSAGSAVTALALSSGSATNPSLVVNLTRSGPRPGTGTYSIGTGAGQFSGSIFLSFQNRTFTISSGSITIDVSSIDGGTGTLRGSVDVTGLATGFNEQLHVTGDFTARCNVVGSVTC